MCTLLTAIERLAQIKAEGYVPTKRRGPTGVGFTLETLLDIRENNLIAPDLSEVEMKTTRVGSQSMVTLFTMDRGCWVVPQVDAIRRFGTIDDDRTNFYSTFMCSGRSSKLRLITQEDGVCLVTPNRELIAQWSFKSLLDRFHQKVRHVLFVLANVKTVDGIEHFHYYEAKFLTGWMFPWHLPRLFNESVLRVDVRMHLKDERVRNHGTGFRVLENDLWRLYPHGEELPI